MLNFCIGDMCSPHNKPVHTPFNPHDLIKCTLLYAILLLTSPVLAMSPTILELAVNPIRRPTAPVFEHVRAGIRADGLQSAVHEPHADRLLRRRRAGEGHATEAIQLRGAVVVIIAVFQLLLYVPGASETAGQDDSILGPEIG
jgi:hypothetical protein